MTASNSDDLVYTARLEVRVRELEALVGQQGDALAELVKLAAADSEVARLDRSLSMLVDRFDQLAARFRILEQSAGE